MKHQSPRMLLAVYEGNPAITGGFPSHKGPVTWKAFSCRCVEMIWVLGSKPKYDYQGMVCLFSWILVETCIWMHPMANWIYINGESETDRQYIYTAYLVTSSFWRMCTVCPQRYSNVVIFLLCFVVVNLEVPDGNIWFIYAYFGRVLKSPWLSGSTWRYRCGSALV